MQDIKLIRTGYFPLRKLKIRIDGQSYSLKGKDIINLDSELKEYNINLSMDWWQANKKVTIGEGDKSIYIGFCLPDWFFIFGFMTICLLSVLTFFGIINPIIVSSALLVFVLPQLYFMFLKKEKYFTIKVI